MTPTLPLAAIRAALAASDWDAAEALLVRHEAELQAACAGASPTGLGGREAWLDLLAAQRALVEELRTARDEAGRALERLGRERRGMAAYLQVP